MRLTVGLALGLLAFAGTAGAVDIKIASVAPDGSRWMQQMRAGAEEVNARTNGRVAIKFYPGGVMGNGSWRARGLPREPTRHAEHAIVNGSGA
jgi:TRAP-type C4-dicarboxylate transport system substrate-binding protein